MEKARNYAKAIGLEVRDALVRWEPRIDLDSVEVTVDAKDPALLYVEITYTIKTTNDRRNLVFPFYAIPSEAE